MKEQDNMNENISSAKIRLGDRLAILYVKELEGFFIEFSYMNDDDIFNSFSKYCLIGKGNQAYETTSPNHKHHLMTTYFSSKNTIKGTLEEIIVKALKFNKEELIEICDNAHVVHYYEH